MTDTFKTPILLLIFNRPDITQQLFNQIKIIKPSYLYVAADGPRFEYKDDLINCTKTREIINQINWQCNVKTLFRDVNLGCGIAISSAINWFFNHVEKGIILEDDCIPDLSFFPYCEELLDMYKYDENIFIISGTNVQNGKKRGNESYFFSNYSSIWGWASWRRAWLQYTYDLPDFDYLFKNGHLDHVFQSYNEKLYWRNKIQKLEEKKIKHTWDYQWLFAMWKNKGVCITPNINLIANIGFRNNSTHVFLKDSLREPSIGYSIQFPLIHPPKIINKEADRYTFKNAYSHSVIRLLRLIKENGIINILRYSLSNFI